MSSKPTGQQQRKPVGRTFAADVAEGPGVVDWRTWDAAEKRRRRLVGRGRPSTAAPDRVGNCAPWCRACQSTTTISRSRPSCLNMWPIQWCLCYHIAFNICLSLHVFTFLSTSSLVTLTVQLILSIFLHIRISEASVCLVSVSVSWLCTVPHSKLNAT